MLTPDQREAWARDGYLVLPGFVPPEQCAALRARAAELVHELVPQDGPELYRDYLRKWNDEDWLMGSGDCIRAFFDRNAFGPGRTLRQAKELSISKLGHALHDLDPVFAEFSRSPAVAELAADLGYRNPLLIQSLFNFKQPHLGSEFQWHQDGAFLYTEPMTLVTFWFALEDATRENGCLEVLRGAHAGPLRMRFRRPRGGRSGMQVLDGTPYPEGDLTALEVPAGTCICIHALLPHLSGPNRSSRSRNAYVLSLYEADSRYAEENWLRRNDLPLRGFA